MEAAVPRPAVIDTDPGLDDAIAILLALASPEIALRGLTSVAGNIGLERTTRNAGALLALGGASDVPVVAGAATPLRRPGRDAADVHGDDGLGGVALPAPAAPPLGEAASDWLARQIAAMPGLDLLALGPLTNVARLLEARPDSASGIGRIVVMGGAVREPGNVGPRAEFNFAFDPEAAAVVLGAGLPLTLIPLDVTRKVRADRAWTARLAQSGGAGARIASALVEAYFAGGRESRPLHDPCVILYAIAPALFTVERLPIRVDIPGTADDGATVIDPAAGREIDVLTGVDARAVLDLLGTRLASL